MSTYIAVTDRGIFAESSSLRAAVRWADHPSVARREFVVFRQDPHDPCCRHLVRRGTLRWDSRRK